MTRTIHRRRIAFPVKLNDGYPCQGFDAEGAPVYFEDLLYEGDQVADFMDEDGNLYGPMHTVVYRDDGLWIEPPSRGQAPSTGSGDPA